MKATVREGQAPAVVVALEPGETLTSEAGAMMFVSGDVQMDVEMPGGLMSGLKRAALAGESLFLVKYVARGSGAVGICGPFPGSIREHELNGEIICEKHAYLGHVGEVAIESALAQRLGMGIAGGGEGFFLQRLKGQGTVWLHGGGDFLDFDLAEGQTLVVDTGCMVMVEPTVKYEVKMQGGIKKSLFGGEGLFLVHMTGPGHVTLQTLPFSRTARRVLEAAHGGSDERSVGGLLGTSSANKEAKDMGLLDKAKAAAEQAAAKAKEGVEDVQTKRDLSQAYGELGKTTYRLVESGELSNPELTPLVEKIRTLEARTTSDLVTAGTTTTPEPPPPDQPPAMPT